MQNLRFRTIEVSWLGICDATFFGLGRLSSVFLFAMRVVFTPSFWMQWQIQGVFLLGKSHPERKLLV